MSFRYQLLKRVMPLMGVRKMFDLPQDELIRRVSDINAKRTPLKLPKSDKAFTFERLRTESGFEYIKVVPEGADSRKALLCFHGGGYLVAPTTADLKTAAEFGRLARRVVYFPLYPLCTEYSIRTTFDMALEVYGLLTKAYEAKDIVVMGASSGAALAIGMLLHNNAKGRPFEMPACVAALSPGSVPADEKVLAGMKAREAADFMLPAVFMERIRPIMEHGETVPDYMLSGELGDFTGFPRALVVYGGDEMLAAAAEGFETAFKKYGVDYRIHIEPGMFHCYPLFAFLPEGKKGREMVLNWL